MKIIVFMLPKRQLNTMKIIVMMCPHCPHEYYENHSIIDLGGKNVRSKSGSTLWQKAVSITMKIIAIMWTLATSWGGQLVHMNSMKIIVMEI